MSTGTAVVSGVGRALPRRRYAGKVQGGLSIFVVSVAKRGFNRSRQLAATELSGHNQCKEMKRRAFLTTTMAASVN